MTVVVAILGLVALIQGVAWLGNVDRTGAATRRRRWGAVLAPGGLLLVALALGQVVRHAGP